jgi:hypothetical protein
VTHGISFPVDQDGNRPTSATGREVVADALRPVDPVGARAAAQETAWRSRYLLHFRRLVEAGLPSPDAWQEIAGAGLDSVRRRMVVADETGEEPDQPVESVVSASSGRELTSILVTGEGRVPETFELPYRGQRLSGGALHERLVAWERAGVLEPSAAEAIREVDANPEWLRLEGHAVAVLGAGAEMGPLRPLLSWGATVAAVDLPQPPVWERVLDVAHGSAGRLLVPVSAGSGDDLTRDAGADLLAEVPAVADWLADLDGGRLVVGNYLYADGGTHVRVSVAADLVGTRVTGERPDTALAFLATPTDVFVVPHDAVTHANRAYDERSGAAKAVGRPLRWLSRGRLLHRAYPPDADLGIGDCLVPAQGPNYALAKRIQRWRATTARRDGRVVSFHVAPSTRTRSVVKNRALAAAFAGAHRFGVEVFDPDTSNTLMAALLVHDLVAGVPSGDRTGSHPWEDEAYAAVHGGLWRAPYEPRSALGLAAVLGYASATS